MPDRTSGKTYGKVSAERQKEMTGLEFVQGLAQGTLPLNMMAQTLDYDIIEAENGRVVVTANPKEIYLNPWGTVHGGLAATMLDFCMGLAIQSRRQRHRLDNPGIQNLLRASYHVRNRPHPGRGRCN